MTEDISEGIRERNHELFALCNSWVMGLLSSTDFERKSMTPHGTSMHPDLWHKDSPLAKKLGSCPQLG